MKTRLRGCCAGWPMRGSRQRCGRCTASSRVRGPWPSSRRRPRFRARRSSSASRAPWACRRWNTCSPGAWPSRRICSAATTSGSPRSPNASATARRAPSAPRSAGTWASLRVATRARPRSRRAPQPRDGSAGHPGEGTRTSPGKDPHVQQDAVRRARRRIARARRRGARACGDVHRDQHQQLRGRIAAQRDQRGQPGPSQDTIRFAIPGMGVHTITPVVPLPVISQPVSIKGYTQPGSSPATAGARPFRRS